jgi:YfiH family protein
LPPGYELVQKVSMACAEFLTSPLLSAAGFRHAFFTRGGGVSEGPYRSLNCSFSVGDEGGRVQVNVERVAAALGVGAAELFWLTQTHGRDVRVVRPGDSTQMVRPCPGDGLVTGVAALACGVRIADCVPVLIGDRKSGMVAAVHAGWRGVVARVIEAAVSSLRAELSEPGDLVAAIGPHISVAAFEVSDDVAAALALASSADRAVDRTLGPKPHVDLGRIVRTQLGEVGIPDDQVDDVPGCTVGDAEHFFSFRRDGPRSGRHLAAIVARSRGS